MLIEAEASFVCVRWLIKFSLFQALGRRATAPVFPDHALIKSPPERITVKTLLLQYRREVCKLQGVKNGSSKFLGLGKFWPDLEVLKRFLGLQVSFSGEFASRTLIKD